MKRYLNNLFPIMLFVLFLLFSINAEAATLEETINQLSGAAAKNYVKPMVSSYCADMNGGWFHKAPKAKLLGWDLEFGVVMMATPFRDKDKTFEVNGNFSFTREQAEHITASYQSALTPEAYEGLVTQIMQQQFTVGISGPTIVGDVYDQATGANSINIVFPSQDVSYTYVVNNQALNATQPIDEITFPLGVGGLLGDIPVKLFPLATPQLSFGTIAGTSFSVRYLPDVEITPELGKLKYMGYGIQHNPAFWFGLPLPVNVALAFSTQTINIGDIVESKATTYGLNVSKTFGPRMLNVTPYLGFSAESANMTFKYDYQTDETPAGDPIVTNIKFELDGENKTRLTAGLSFRLALINLNFDYNISEYSSGTAGLMLNFSW